jgi:hypothetical protein
MHHAYLVKGKGEERELRERLGAFLTIADEHIEWIYRTAANFKIDDARELKEKLSTKTNEGMTRVVCIASVSMNAEAQNTLLKIVEEPGERTYFFFVTSSPEKLLPTLRSRISMADIELEGVGKKGKKTEDTIKDLLKESANIISKIKDEKMNKDDTLVFMDRLIELAKENKMENKKGSETLKKLLTLRSYILDQSASLKQILETAVALSF